MEKNIFRTLTHPTIIETVFAVELELSFFEKSALDSIVRQTVPSSKCEGENINGQLTINPLNRRIDHSQSWIGSRYRINEHRILTVQNNVNDPSRKTVSFALSTLPPYTSWQDFTEQSVSVFKSFVQVARPKAFRRIAVRTIDRFGLQNPNGSLDMLIKNIGDSFSGLSGPIMQEFFHRDNIYFPGEDLCATIVRASQRDARGASPRVILDTDIYTLPKADVALQQLNCVLENIHKVRNTIFFDLIGDKVLEVAE